MGTPEKIRLSEVSSFITKGATPTTYGYNWEKRGILFLRSECVSENGFNLKGSMFISEEANDTMNRSKIKAGDILMSITGNVGRVCIVPENIETGNINQHIAKITIESNIVDRDYVFHYLNQDSIRKEFSKITTGQAYPQLSLEQVRNIEIPLLPILHQKYISKLLNCYDENIGKLTLLVSSKEKLRNNLMIGLLSAELRFKEYKNESFVEGILSEYVDLKHGYQFRKEDFVKEGIPVIKIGNVNGYDLDLDDLTFIDDSRIEEFKDVIISNGDLLMSLTGNIGRVVEVSNMTKPMVQNYRVGKFISRYEDQLSKSYLKHLLSSTIITRQFLNMSNQSAQANFGKQDMDKIFITFPKNIDEQKKISSTITESENEIKNLNLQLERIKLQKRGLMQELLTGKTRIKTK